MASTDIAVASIRLLSSQEVYVVNYGFIYGMPGTLHGKC